MSTPSDILDLFTSDPAAVFSQSAASQASVLETIKHYLDPVIKANTDSDNQQRSIIDEIYVDGLDSSQVWGQAKLVIDDVSENLLADKIPELKALFTAEESQDESEEGDELEELDEEDEALDEAELDEEELELDEEDELEELEELEANEEEVSEEEVSEEEEEEEVVDETEAETEIVKTTKSADTFGLNDDFFDIDEFNRQTLAAEANDDEEDDGIDMFGDLSDSDEEVPYFDDFFDKPNEKTVLKKVKTAKKEAEVESEAEEGDLNEDDYDNAMNGAMMDLFAEEEVKPVEANLSSFQKHQKLIQEEIAKLEEEAVAVKKWSMKGEAKAKDRPTDSLLEEDLEFERTAKPVPVITKESTESLEEMIRRRIKAEEWDDLPRRVITDLKNFRSSNRFEVSETKSAKSLAELYEDDFHKQNLGAEAAPSAADTELTKAHEEITSMYQSLSHKLDSLCSAHFVPKPQQKSLEVKVNVSAISMEDAQPLAGSTTTTLAPQEIYNATDARGLKTGNGEIKLKSGLVMSKDELSRDDKQRFRRAVKRKRGKEIAEKAIAAKASGAPATKKSKQNDVIETLAKASNITVVGKKGEMRDVKGALKKEKVLTGSSRLKL